MSKLRVVTWNLWWDEFESQQRLNAVLEILQSLEPDVIALQETTAHTSLELAREFSDYHSWPPQPGRSGLLILSKETWSERGQLRLSGCQGRQMVWYRTDDLLIATVHLESTRGKTRTRRDQLQEVFRFLRPYGRTVLLGDFNFAPGEPEEAQLDPSFCDTWEQLRPDDPGFTEDTDINAMRLLHTNKAKQVRYDRILCRGGLDPTSIQLLGTAPLPDRPTIWPSDHFGLVCDLSLSQAGSQRQTCQRLLMLGQEHLEYGSWSQESLGRAFATLSVGADPDSPSMAAKADRSRANEDGLLVLTEGERYLLAVADGHFGNTTSHALLKRLSASNIPESPRGLRELLDQIQRPELVTGAGSTLTVAVLDTSIRRGFGSALGDSPLSVVSQSTYRPVFEGTESYFYFNRPLPSEEWPHFEFGWEPDEAVLLFSDGVNECCYRKPECSIQPSHIQTLWGYLHQQPAEFTGQLTRLALTGILGHPGGQDNIALIVFPPERKKNQDSEPAAGWRKLDPSNT